MEQLKCTTLHFNFFHCLLVVIHMLMHMEVIKSKLSLNMLDKIIGLIHWERNLPGFSVFMSRMRHKAIINYNNAIEFVSDIL